MTTPMMVNQNVFADRVVGAAVRASLTASIPNGGTTSNVLDLDATATTLVGFFMSNGWTTASLTIEVSTDNSRWSSAVYDSNGVQVNQWSAPAADQAYAVDAMAMLPWRYIRFKAGTAQAAQRDIAVVVRPIA